MLPFVFRTFCSNLHGDIDKRYPRYGCEEKAFAYAHLLHPGQKGTILFKVGLWQSTIDMLIMDEEGAPEEVNLDEAMNLDEEDEEQAMLIQASQGMMEERRSETSPLEKEWLEYRAGGLVISKNLDVLNWWSIHEKQFPLLAKITRKYLCVQATSCSAERTFSTGGSTVTAKRNKLDPDNVNKLVYLRENLGKVKIEKLILEDDEEKEIEKECLAETEKELKLN